MGAISTIRNKIASWYQGTYVPPPKNAPNSGVVFIGHGFYVQPRLARYIGAVIRFYFRHWQWLWSTVIAVASLYVAVLALK